MLFPQKEGNITTHYIYGWAGEYIEYICGMILFELVQREFNGVLFGCMFLYDKMSFKNNFFPDRVLTIVVYFSCWQIYDEQNL